MAGRANQKLRTRNAIVQAAAELSRTGREVTMSEVAKAALVSEATAYRYFPDLASLLREAIAGQLPDPAEALAPVAGCDDPVERIAAATEFLLRHVLSRQGVVRALIAATITRPGEPQARPGLRFGLIDSALAPLEQHPRRHRPRRPDTAQARPRGRRQRRGAVQPDRRPRPRPRGGHRQHRAHRHDPHPRRVRGGCRVDVSRTIRPAAHARCRLPLSYGAGTAPASNLPIAQCPRSACPGTTGHNYAAPSSALGALTPACQLPMEHPQSRAR